MRTWNPTRITLAGINLRAWVLSLEKGTSGLVQALLSSLEMKDHGDCGPAPEVIDKAGSLPY